MPEINNVVENGVEPQILFGIVHENEFKELEISGYETPFNGTSSQEPETADVPFSLIKTFVDDEPAGGSE